MKHTTSYQLSICCGLLICLYSCQIANDLTPNALKGTEKSATLTPSVTVQPTQPPMQANLVKEKWLGGIPCSPPCFEGVVPGKTSASESIKIWSRNFLFNKVESEKPALGNDGFVIFSGDILLDNGKIGQWGGVSIYDYTSSDQTIYVIRLGLNDLPVSVGEFIKTYGEPTHLMAYRRISPDINGADGWGLDIIWLPKGFVVYSSLEMKSKPQLSPNLILNRVAYFPPTLEGYGKTIGTGFIQSVRPWRGYDNIEWIDH